MAIRNLRLPDPRHEISRVFARIKRKRSLRKGLALARAGNAEAALVLLANATSGTVEDAGVHNARAGLLFNLGRFEEALEELSLAIGLDPGSSDQFINRGNIHRGQGRFVEAVQDYTLALELNPSDTGGLTALAGVLNRIGRHRDALKAAEKAVTIDPTCEPAWFHMGNTLFALRRFEEAKEAYTRAPGIYPNDAYAWTERADRMMKLGRVAEAKKASDMAALIAIKKLNIRRCEREIERMRREHGIS